MIIKSITSAVVQSDLIKNSMCLFYNNDFQIVLAAVSVLGPEDDEKRRRRLSLGPSLVRLDDK